MPFTALPTSLVLLLLTSASVLSLASPLSIRPPNGLSGSIQEAFAVPILLLNQETDFPRLSQLIRDTSCQRHPTLSSTGYVRPSPLSTSATYEVLNSVSDTTLVPFEMFESSPEGAFDIISWVSEAFYSEATPVLASLQKQLAELSSSPEEVFEMVGSGLSGPLVLLHAMNLLSRLPPSSSSQPIKITVTLLTPPRFTSGPNLASLLRSSPLFKDRLLVRTIRHVGDPMDQKPSWLTGSSSSSPSPENAWEVSARGVLRRLSAFDLEEGGREDEELASWDGLQFADVHRGLIEDEACPI